MIWVALSKALVPFRRFFEPVEEHNPPTLALRFRFASRADIQFVQSWNEATSSAATVTIARTVLNGTGVVPEENRERAVLVTELEEWDVQGASFGSAVTSTLRRSPRRRQHVFRIKPCPDSNESAMKEQLVNQDELKSITQQPSRQWVEAGSGTLGRLHLEILSCSQLPNVDYGNAVGNETDAFVTAMYGDAMVQTEIIDDELSPHWPPWSQRAFCFSIMHPSQVLYLGVFGYKRGLFNHAPIGRVEVNLVNFQHDSEYNLEYDLFAECHVTNRRSAGKIRIRLRMEVFDERVALLAALRPCPSNLRECSQEKNLSTWRVLQLRVNTTIQNRLVSKSSWHILMRLPKFFYSGFCTHLGMVSSHWCSERSSPSGPGVVPDILLCCFLRNSHGN